MRGGAAGTWATRTCWELGRAIVRQYLPEAESKPPLARLDDATERTAALLGFDGEVLTRPCRRTTPGRRIGVVLADFFKRAIEESADALEFQYQDGELHVMVVHGSMGVGIGAIKSNSKACDLLLDEIIALKRRKRFKLGAKTLGIAVSTYDSFGETAWRIELSQAR